MSVTDGIGQTPCSLEHYVVVHTLKIVINNHTVKYIVTSITGITFKVHVACSQMFGCACMIISTAAQMLLNSTT